jgi:hypothetical protein
LQDLLGVDDEALEIQSEFVSRLAALKRNGQSQVWIHLSESYQDCNNPALLTSTILQYMHCHSNPFGAQKMKRLKMAVREELRKYPLQVKVPKRT